MTQQTLIKTVHQLVNTNKGLLAMDESNPTCNKRFAELAIPQTEQMRRDYRKLLITAKGLGDSVSGVILSDETFHQHSSNQQSFIKVIDSLGIIAGIKVDAGTAELAACPGEKITEGLDKLRPRLQQYAQQGALFAKWRAVFSIAEHQPSRACIQSNAQHLALYAALCQESGLVPIVEPEILMEGNHTLAQCASITERVLHAVFEHLYQQRVLLEGLILKPNMVLPGELSALQESDDVIANVTVQCLLRSVPASVSGIAFLSGGQSPEHATSRLNAMNLINKYRLPWKLIFSFSRAIQTPVLATWKGKAANIEQAQQILIHRVKCNQAALNGEYSAKMETMSGAS